MYYKIFLAQISTTYQPCIIGNFYNLNCVTYFLQSKSFVVSGTVGAYYFQKNSAVDAVELLS